MSIITRKIGRNRGKPRLWIEGKALLENGFTHGTRWTLQPCPSGFILRADPDGKRKVAGKPARPIIDIVGASLGTLQTAEKVVIMFPNPGLASVAELVDLNEERIAA